MIYLQPIWSVRFIWFTAFLGQCVLYLQQFGLMFDLFAAIGGYYGHQWDDVNIFF